MSDEVTLYSRDGILITTTRTMFGAKTYAMANVTSVSMSVIPAKRRGGITVAIIGLLLLISMSEAGISAGIIGLAVLALGIAIALMAKATYIVRLGSASGETDALSSTNREFIEGIVGAVNEAIIKRG